MITHEVENQAPPRVGVDEFAANVPLVEAVMSGLDVRRGESAWDLYCGVGLFAGPLVDAGVSVRGVEMSRTAVREASRNVPEARFEAGRVEQVVRRWPNRVDLVVCDPPRTGVGKAVVEQVVRRRPRRIAGRRTSIERRRGKSADEFYRRELTATPFVFNTCVPPRGPFLNPSGRPTDPEEFEPSNAKDNGSTNRSAFRRSA